MSPKQQETITAASSIEGDVNGKITDFGTFSAFLATKI